MEIYKRLLIYLKPYRTRLLWSVVFMGITSALISLQAYIVQPVLDNVFLNKNMKLLLLLPPALMAVVIIKGAAAYARDYLMGWIGQKIVNDIRDQLYSHLTVSFLFLFHKDAHRRPHLPDHQRREPCPGGADQGAVEPRAGALHDAGPDRATSSI